MNKQEYMKELTNRLSPLPLSQDDIADALRYYDEYFDEAGPEREQAVIAELGSPAYVAAQIALKLSESVSPLTEKTGMRRNFPLLRTVLIGVAAAPVALPLILAGAVVMLSLIIAAAALVFSFGLSGVVCAAVGIAVMVYAVVSGTGGLAVSIYLIGSGLFSLGIGGLLFKLGLWIGKLCFKAAGFVGARIIRRNNPAAEYTVRTDYPEGRLQ